MKISGNSKDFTPKKPAKRGPKPKEGSANDICRLCFTNLKQKFGDFEKSLRISTANLFKPSTQAACQNNDTLADLCSRIGLDVVKSSTLSERVCQSYARKIRNAVQQNSTRLFTNPLTAEPLAFTASQPNQKHSRTKIPPATQAKNLLKVNISRFIFLIFGE